MEPAHEQAAQCWRLAVRSPHFTQIPHGFWGLKLSGIRMGAARTTQTPAGSHHGNRAQDRDYLLHDGEEASRMQRNTLGGARRSTGETVRSQNQTQAQQLGYKLVLIEEKSAA